jgi:predicted dehydrogenase
MNNLIFYFVQGIFGANCYSQQIVPMLSEKNFVISAVWDKNLVDAEKFAKQFQIGFFSNKVDDILLHKNVQVIFVFSQPFFLSHIVVKSLGVGKHVIAHPPFLNLADTIKMNNASSYYPSLISLVFHPQRLIPAFIQMKKAMHDGIIGNVQFIEVNVKVPSLINEKFDWKCDSKEGSFYPTSSFRGKNNYDSIF